jgi:hypothetical protein
MDRSSLQRERGGKWKAVVGRRCRERKLRGSVWRGFNLRARRRRVVIKYSLKFIKRIRCPAISDLL